MYASTEDPRILKQSWAKKKSKWKVLPYEIPGYTIDKYSMVIGIKADIRARGTEQRTQKKTHYRNLVGETVPDTVRGKHSSNRTPVA